MRYVDFHLFINLKCHLFYFKFYEGKVYLHVCILWKIPLKKINNPNCYHIFHFTHPLVAATLHFGNPYINGWMWAELHSITSPERKTKTRWTESRVQEVTRMLSRFKSSQMSFFLNPLSFKTQITSIINRQKLLYWCSEDQIKHSGVYTKNWPVDQINARQKNPIKP